VTVVVYLTKRRLKSTVLYVLCVMHESPPSTLDYADGDLRDVLTRVTYTRLLYHTSVTSYSRDLTSIPLLQTVPLTIACSVLAFLRVLFRVLAFDTVNLLPTSP